ncbi:MAG: ATP-binding protein, partial [Proteobacteria bacterium]|nr:ATP-binding protein [Pseudomonadota bacterium]
MNQININIPSISENIRMIESFIDNAKDQFKITDDLYGNIMVAVTEAVNNAIIHGNQKDPKKLVDLTLKLEEKELSFIVKDEGPGFDHENLPDPTSPENLEKVGGRGIF